MGVRRRAVRERVERKAKLDKGFAEFSASLDRIKRVVDEAIAEGLKTLTPEEFARRLDAIDGGAMPTAAPPMMTTEDVLRIFAPLPPDEAAALREYGVDDSADDGGTES